MFLKFLSDGAYLEETDWIYANQCESSLFGFFMEETAVYYALDKTALIDKLKTDVLYLALACGISTNPKCSRNFVDFIEWYLKQEYDYIKQHLSTLEEKGAVSGSFEDTAYPINESTLLQCCSKNKDFDQFISPSD